MGYSELFSLSREDVLAAMKDYPEAQEILQSLGRKRLMEARNVSRPKSSGHHDKGTGATTGSGSKDGVVGGDGDARAGKRIVEKLRSDVKGLKNVLRKSRRGTRLVYIHVSPTIQERKVLYQSKKESSITMELDENKVRRLELSTYIVVFVGCRGILRTMFVDAAR